MGQTINLPIATTEQTLNYRVKYWWFRSLQLNPICVLIREPGHLSLFNHLQRLTEMCRGKIVVCMFHFRRRTSIPPHHTDSYLQSRFDLINLRFARERIHIWWPFNAHDSWNYFRLTAQSGLRAMKQIRVESCLSNWQLINNTNFMILTHFPNIRQQCLPALCRAVFNSEMTEFL